MIFACRWGPNSCLKGYIQREGRKAERRLQVNVTPSWLQLKDNAVDRCRAGGVGRVNIEVKPASTLFACLQESLTSAETIRGDIKCL